MNNQSQRIRKIIYDTIYKESSNETQNFDPNLNLDFYGIYAESLIYECAKAIQLPNEYVKKYFLYNLYFFQETPFTGFILIMRGLTRLLNKLFSNYFKVEEKEPITAQQFADIMIEIWKKYQADMGNNVECDPFTLLKS
ncbi:hypothetical protein COMX_10273 [Commensalibacter papalotli (ex Servin-Garciduenas et al. 2014)]|uniref:Uncharacterized protein n=2 Tax=Commensalibacter papalotli (ex Servin-Garciduenas et al. 2014) TaxID=1208583 RepID=W7DT41_9PROT|nr:hypothetical protein COMX_10273 [Commensalibacter papalotli (ex Servin-Garciduenas et al. 2014)]